MGLLTLQEEQRELKKVEMEKTRNRYRKLIERQNELLSLGKEFYQKQILLLEQGKELSKEEKQIYNECSQEEYCITAFFECEGYRTYEGIASFCKENNIGRIVDIGCAYGHQSEAFRVEKIDYVGINHHKSNFFNGDQFTYISGLYPMEIPVQKGDLGVSVLCLTWNCYLWEGEKTLREQLEALNRDFEHILLHAQKDRVEYVQRYFPNMKEVGSGLYYFTK